MKYTHLFFIINPFAGQDEPVVEIIDRVFLNSGHQLTIYVLKEGEKAPDVILKTIGRADLIAVYGGDGTVTEAATALIGTGTPLAIIPGGTANVLAKELGIPVDTESALKLIRDGNYVLKTIDTGIVNNTPFLLRVNLGIMAEMITKTNPELKEQIGQLAYGISTIKSVYEATSINYNLRLDGKIINESGVALTVTNSGNMGIGEFQLWPGISVSDGLLDVLLLKDANFLSLIKVAGSTLTGLKTDAISHWQCREIIITMPQENHYICDDCEISASELNIKVVPASLSVIVPSSVE